MASTFTWTAGSGDWSDGANWMDVSAPGAGTAPGTADAATIDGPSFGFDLIAGPGSAAFLTTAGNVVFDGTFAFGTLTNDIDYADLTLVSAGSVVSADTSTLSGLVQIDGPGASLDAGTVTLSSPDIVIEDHATFRASSLSDNAIAGQFILDATSTAEIGGGTIATAGTLAVDAGAVAMVNGTIDAPILDQGTIETAATLTLTGAVSGGGTIALTGTSDLLVLNGAVASGMTIDFADHDGVLVLPELSAGTMAATIAGFMAGDEIDIRAAGVNGVTYAATGDSLGTLAFTANGATVETLTIAGDYTGQTFLLLPGLQSYVDPLATTAGLVLAPNTPTTPVAAATGSGTDAFSWQLVDGGSWDDPNNWSANGRVPGAGNPVTLSTITGGSPGAIAIVNGDGNSASLAIDGSVALNGTFSTGALTINQNVPLVNAASGTLDLLAGTVVTATSVATGVVLVDGAGASLSVGGTLDAGNFLGTTGLLAINGGDVLAGSLVLAGTGVTLDASSAIEVGTGGHAIAGTLVVDSGALLTAFGNTTIDVAISNDGTLLARGQHTALTNAVTGNGTIQIAAYDSLALSGAINGSETIQFTGANATLDLTAEDHLTAPITGIALTDAFRFGANVTGVNFVSTGADTGILTATDVNGVAVQTLTVSGDLDGNSFVLNHVYGTGSSFTASGQSAPGTDAVLTSGSPPAPDAVPGQVKVVAGNTLTVGSVTADDVEVIGKGASLDVTGAVNGIPPGYFMYSTSVSVTDGAHAQIGSLAVGAGIEVDSLSALEVGTSGNAALGGMMIDAGQVVFGSSIRAAVHNDGSLVDSSVIGAIDGSGTLIVQQGGTVSVDGSIASTQTIDFLGTTGTLILSAPTDATIIGFGANDTIELLGTATNGTYTATGAGSGRLDIANDGATIASLTLAGDYSSTRFLTVAEPAVPSQPVTMTAIVIAACFAEGTRIATDHGAVPIERLTVGTLVHTPWNQMLPIEWIGRRRTDCRHHPRPHDVWPVRVSAHAFGPGRPVQDLFLSPDHAVHIDGLDGPDLLIPVRYLINDATIRQIATDEVVYWHIELPRHDVVLAEGLSCESYLDTGNRCAFENGGPAVALHPDFARAIWAEQACAELTLAGPALTAVRAALLMNAQALGHVATDDAGLTVHADGNLLVPDGSFEFDLPAGTQTAEIRSRTAVPAHVHADAQDCRKLGVAVADLTLDGKPVPPDDPRFGTGWFPAEPEWRWTDGHATLATGGATRLSLRLKPYLTYWIADDVRPESAPASLPTAARPEKPLRAPRRAGRDGRAARL